ncbi:hypothetical protein BD311DRAFT_653233 [Dichomitus squalens]|uniref:Glycoside hydrolase superfamily n=1 Tax=Dichomitus squalens TaxID=114155 RepID=A0A4Q9MZP9_9APHY|nr:hypothetical protein BD311DRAFT_653233 [Dichomitus squalens]
MHTSAAHQKTPAKQTSSGASSGCFPALVFKTPANDPDSLDGRWCDDKTEYAFLGFSYEVSACDLLARSTRTFANIRNNFNGRYIRLYGACDKSSPSDDVVEAAYKNGLGVHDLIWFGYDGDNKWETRRDALFSSLHSNPKAKFITRAVQFGSKPLVDGVLPASQLAAQVKAVQDNLAGLKIFVTVSDMQWSFQMNGGAGLKVLDVVDVIDAHMLPFFSGNTTTSAFSFPLGSRALRSP